MKWERFSVQLCNNKNRARSRAIDTKLPRRTSVLVYTLSVPRLLIYMVQPRVKWTRVKMLSRLYQNLQCNVNRARHVKISNCTAPLILSASCERACVLIMCALWHTVVALVARTQLSVDCLFGWVCLHVFVTVNWSLLLVKHVWILLGHSLALSSCYSVEMSLQTF